MIPWLGDLAIDLDGASGSLGIEEEPRTLKANQTVFSPIICYESIYGEFIAEQVRKGAEEIFLITNDGWWGNTPGIHQHFDYSRLRALETRRFVARAANTGISGFINSQGDVLSFSEWWKEDALKMSVNLNSTLTFYAEHGDYIAKLATILALLAIVFNWRKPMYED
jgi:apolipoprotein N-acyltransferase